MPRTYVLTTMERAFETDYAYAHHFMNGYEGDARTTASQLAYRVMRTGFLQFECRRALMTLEVVFRNGGMRIHNLGCVNVFKCQE